MPAEAIATRISPAAGLLTPLDESSCELQTGADSLDALAVFVAMLGVDFEVREPAELIDHVRALEERLARSVGRTRSAPPRLQHRSAS